jgi:flagellar basal body rod protein FlgB
VESSETRVRLDQEMAQMAENAVRYQALIGAIERTLSTLRYAARDGREG